MSDATTQAMFFRLLFGDSIGENQLLLIWSLPSKASRFFSNIEEAVAYIATLNGKEDIYFGTCLLKHRVKNGRGAKVDIAAVYATWVDVDIVDPAHKKCNLPATIAEARALVDELGLPPSIIVESGHGLQAYWLLKEPMPTGTPEELAAAERLTTGWIGRLKKLASAHTTAAGEPWDVDSVGDVTRVFRVPATVNRKVPEHHVPVRFVVPATEADVLPRYAAEGFTGLVVPETSTKPPRANVGDQSLPLTGQAGGEMSTSDNLVLDPQAKPPHTKWEALCENDLKFKRSWLRTRKDLTDQSPSAYDMSLAILAGQVGWTDQEITNLLIASRRKYGDDLKIDRRDNYYARTISKARRAAASRAESTPFARKPAPKVIEPYRPFPVKFLPQPLRSFVAEGAVARDCDPAFIALPLLAAIAAVIGNAFRIALKRGWFEPPILWAVIVGDSGTGKSPALELALRALRNRQHKAMLEYQEEWAVYKEHLADYLRDLQKWKASRQKNGEDPPEKPEAPICTRYYCDDVTVEALAVLLQQNWRGLLLVRDELAGWFGSFDRYAAGKGDAPKFLEMFHGRTMIIDRKTGDPPTIYVPRAALCITGGIQPAPLQRALGRDYFENGLAARLLLACPPRRPRFWTEDELDPATEAAVARVLDFLLDLQPAIGDRGESEPRVVELSPGAKEIWVRYYNTHAAEQVELAGDLSAAWSKLECYAARLALVIHLVRFANGKVANGAVVEAESMAAGVALANWFAYETRRVYSLLDESDEDREQRDLLELIRRHGGRATTRYLMRSGRKYRRNAEVAEAALHALVLAGLGRWEAGETRETGGQPTREFILTDTGDGDRTPESPGETEVLSPSPPEAGPNHGPPEGPVQDGGGTPPPEDDAESSEDEEVI